MSASNTQISLQPNTRYGATVLVNSPVVQTVTLHIDGGNANGQQFVGSAASVTSNLGTYVFSTGASGKVTLDVTSDGASSSISVRDMLSSLGCVVAGASGKGDTHQLFNDALVVFNGPLK
ncbi:fucose-binding lectin II [Burkholderia dolosa]|jgi:hypothetical protein|uniref:fucose-binding lectin II n=1 Tax=Burkholderia dolosa TaxID=152500 RepID=UPI001C96E440|nr:fucose-binding lectin II [Burkholderia dolosa]MBY4829505.1 fucose-binding lectin II [Burkholderia dolosa]